MGSLCLYENKRELARKFNFWFYWSVITLALHDDKIKLHEALKKCLLVKHLIQCLPAWIDLIKSTTLFHFVYIFDVMIISVLYKDMARC